MKVPPANPTGSWLAYSRIISGPVIKDIRTEISYSHYNRIKMKDSRG